MSKQFYDVNTITATFERAKAENLGVSRNFIRESCLNGTLKHCRAGKKFLIYYPNLIELLQNGNNAIPQADNIGDIRRVPENINKLHR